MPTGLRITYRLLHKVLPEVGESNGDMQVDDGAKVIELKAHKTKKPNPSDRVLGATCSSSASQNGGIRKLQVAEFGRREDNVLEPTELSIGRVYEVQWKKEKPNLEEIARFYWVDGLTQRQVAERVSVRRATVADAAKKFKTLFENQRDQEG